MVSLVVVAHADDESLGCAGTISKLAADGESVFVLSITDGVSARGNNFGATERRAQFHSACSLLGASAVDQRQYAWIDDFVEFDNQLDAVSLLRVIQHIETVIRIIQPRTIYTHHAGDLNIDHHIVARAVLTATRPPTSVERIYSFEVPSSTEWSYGQLDHFVPNVFVDITDHIDKKLAAICTYTNEVREVPHPRSPEMVRVRAQYWGSVAGYAYAEPLKLVREFA